MIDTTNTHFAMRAMADQPRTPEPISDQRVTEASLDDQLVDTFLTHISMAFARTGLHNLLRQRRRDLAHNIQARKWSRVRYFVRDLPLEVVPEDESMDYVRALIVWRMERFDEAERLLDRAADYYRHGVRNLEYAALCRLELADLAHSRSRFRSADSFLQEGEALLHQVTEPDIYIQAKIHLLHAIIQPELGHLGASIEHGQRGLAAFQECGDRTGEFLSLRALATALMRIGDFDGASSCLEQAMLCFASGLVNYEYFPRIYNIGLQIAWYRGDLDEALKLGQESDAYLAANGYDLQRSYVHTLLANIQRARRDFEAAGEQYTQTQLLIDQLEFDSFQCWLDIHLAWMHILLDNLSAAKIKLHQALDSADSGQRMSFNVVRAVVHMLQGEFPAAGQLLQTSLNFYAYSGDDLSVCAINCLRAWLNHQQGKTRRGLELLDTAMSWMALRGSDYFPHWWHPAIMADLCLLGLEHLPQHLDTLQSMAQRHLAPEMRIRLRAVGDRPDSETLCRLHALQALLDDGDDLLTDYNLTSTLRNVLDGCIARGTVCRERLPALFDMLVTAETRRSPNPMLVAVFLLYLERKSRTEIAELLLCSPSLVRNYVRDIYGIFGVEQVAGESRLARRSRLIEAVQGLELVR